MQRKTFKRTRNSTKLADYEIFDHKMSMIMFLEELYDRHKGFSCLVWQWWNTVTFFGFWVVSNAKKWSFTGSLLTLKIVNNVSTLYIFSKLIENPKVAQIEFVFCCFSIN